MPPLTAICWGLAQSQGPLLTYTLRGKHTMAEATQYVTLTAENFDHVVLQSDRPVLVDFWASWCGPCRLLNPIIDALAEEFAGRVTIAKIDIDPHPELAKQYQIMGVPTLLYFKAGQLCDRSEGVTTQAAITEKLQALLA